METLVRVIPVQVTMLLAEMTVEAEPAQVTEPAQALVAKPMMPIRKTQQVTAARPQRMALILHRHLLER